jgi:hypothetical protein
MLPGVGVIVGRDRLPDTAGKAGVVDDPDGCDVPDEGGGPEVVDPDGSGTVEVLADGVTP